jgi:azurin
MKIRYLLVSLFTALLAAGCSKQETPAAGGTAGSSAPTTAAAPKAAAPAPAAAARVIEITANDAMKFSVTAIEAKVGEELKIVLTNIGTLPKEAMGHNLVVLKPGTDVNAFAAAAMMARDTDFIPAALKDQVVAHTQLLGPRKSDEITFKVTAAGEYPFVCSFPAHAMAGMKGTITVK